MRKNRSVRFGFGGATVLLASRGDQVSFNSTAGVWVRSWTCLNAAYGFGIQ